jgi:DNA polymerase elongation subunit (family B)
MKGTKRAKEIVAALRKHVDENGTLEITVDIESCHNEVKNYACARKQYVGYDQITRERNIIMIQIAHVSARRAKDVYTVEWDWRRWEDRDRFLLEEFLYILYSFNDLIIYSKNGKRFDIPYITGRLMFCGLPSLPEFTHRDIEELIRKNMYLNSFALDYLNKFLGGSGKIRMFRDDWFKIEEGDEKALSKMRRYGKKDIVDTNMVKRKSARYIPELRAYCNILANGTVCHWCKEKKMIWKLEKRGFRRTPSGKRQIWHCTNKKHPVTKPAWFTETRVQRYT